MQGCGGLCLGAGIIQKCLHSHSGLLGFENNSQAGFGGLEHVHTAFQGKEISLLSTLWIHQLRALQIQPTKHGLAREKPTEFMNTCGEHTRGRNSVMSNSKWEQLELGASIIAS